MSRTFTTLSDNGTIGQALPNNPDWYRTSVPCATACPAGTDVPGYLAAIREGRFDEAYRINLRDNVFPAVLGRICTRPCEPACRHGRPGLGDPVAICFSKRSAADYRPDRAPIRLEPFFGASGNRVAVVGAGPGGLAAARDLSLLGHAVTVFERNAVPGGLLVRGIPEFRLPRETVAAEIEQVLLQGVELRTGVAVGSDIPLAELAAEYDAVVVASGAHLPHMPYFEGQELEGVRHGFDFIGELNDRLDVAVNDRVIVIGGGFTAVDCARAAAFLGARDVRLVYRGGRSGMRCTAREFQLLEQEGIAVETFSAPSRFVGDGHVEAVELESVGGERTIRTVAADTVLVATGQTRSFAPLDPALGPLLDRLVAGGQPAHRTGIGNIFLCGEARLGTSSVVYAVGDGRACATEIDLFFEGRRRLVPSFDVEEREETGRERADNALPRLEAAELPVGERTVRSESFTGFTEEEARTEARRCYMCNQKIQIDTNRCISCGLCLMVMPVEDCIVQLKKMLLPNGRTVLKKIRDFETYDALAVDQDACIRCNACRESCPVACITLSSVTPTVQVVEIGPAVRMK